MVLEETFGVLQIATVAEPFRKGGSLKNVQNGAHDFLQELQRRSAVPPLIPS